LRGFPPASTAAGRSARTFDSVWNATVANGFMLMREEHVNEGLEQGILAASPIAQAQFPLFMAHIASRRNDPLIRAFMEATTDVWPDLRVTPTHEMRG